MSDAGAARSGRRPGVRAAVLALLALVAAAFALTEVSAARDRALAGGRESVDASVADVRRDLTGRLLAVERAGAEIAAAALDRTGGIDDPATLFTIAGALPLPSGAGLRVEDREGRLLAWAGSAGDERLLAAVQDAGDGGVLVESASSRRIAVRRMRTVGRPGVPARAVCHLPVEIRSPFRNRYFRSWRIEDDVPGRRRVGDCDVLLPGDEGGTPVPSAFAGTLARIEVSPLAADAWTEVVDAEQAVRRGAFLVAGVLLLGALGAWEVRRLAATRRAAAALAAALLVAAVRAALAFVPAADLLPSSALVDPRRYAHGLPLALAASPADFLLTGFAALGIAACLRRAAQAARRPAATATPATLAALGAALAAGLAFSAAVADAVRNSTVEFFTDVSVLPLPASAALVGALSASGIAAALAVSAAWTWLAPREAPSRAGMLALSAAAGALVVPWGPAGTAADGLLVLLGALGFAAGFAVLVMDAGTAARAAIVPLGAAFAVFAPLEARLAESVRGAVESAARAHMAESDETARFLVRETLDRIEASPALAAALDRGVLSQETQRLLWAETPLAAHSSGSSIEIEPRDPQVPRARFTVNLPPNPWLPGAEAWPPLGEIAAAPLAGRGPGRDGRWLLGSRRVNETGALAANVFVALEVRRPSNPGLPDLELLGPAAERDERRVPALAVSRYDEQGRRVETNDTSGAVPAELTPEVRAAAAEAPAWTAPDAASGGRASVVTALMDDGVARAYFVFSYDTGGLRRVALRGARALLCGAILAAVALLATVRRWGRGARRLLAHRLVLSYAVVSGVPLLVLGWANRELARESADQAAVRELSEAVALFVNVVEEPGAELPLRLLELPDAVREERLRTHAYEAGHHVNVFFGAELLASSDEGLFDTDLLPRRLPGPVYRDLVCLGRPFTRHAALVGDEEFDVGYAPVRTDRDRIAGAVSVPLLRQRRTRDADLADGVTAILALYLTSLVAAVGVGTWLAARLTRPLRELTVATQRVAAGDLSRPVPGAGPGELGEVVGAFNRMMRDLAESRERLVRAEKEAAWRDMARQVAHEVKNPLTPMRLAAEHLRRAFRDGAPNLADVVERSVDLIVRQTESLKRIATAFSDFARLPGRRRDPVDVADLVRRTADLYANSPGVRVTADPGGELPAILADPDELQRVLVNLLKNAVEALGERGGSVAVRARRDAAHVVVEVEDDGPGIPAEVLPRLFEPYFSTKTSGTGLGLAICKRAVDDLGGTIAVRSAAGAGTTVTLRLPLAPAGASG